MTTTATSTATTEQQQVTMADFERYGAYRLDLSDGNRTEIMSTYAMHFPVDVILREEPALYRLSDDQTELIEIDSGGSINFDLPGDGFYVLKDLHNINIESPDVDCWPSTRAFAVQGDRVFAARGADSESDELSQRLLATLPVVTVDDQEDEE